MDNFEYMVDIELPELTKEFIELIPGQVAITNRLMKKGKLTSYTLAQDRTKLWVTLNAATEEEVIEILKSFPIYSYLNYKIYKLAFNNNISFTLPKVSLN